MTQKEKDLISNEINKLLSNCRELEKEMDAQKDGLNFLLEQYKTNKRWFREEPGRVTTEDIIKTCFEFGWASYRNFIENEKRG